MSKTVKFSEEQRRKIVLEVLSGELSKEQARRIYGIKSKSAILEWMRKFASINPRAHGVDPIPKLREMKTISPNEQKLLKRIKELEQQLEYSELKGRAYQLMIEKVERESGIDLKKKSGQKSLPNLKKKKRT